MSQETTAAASEAVITSVTTFVSTMITARNRLLLECQRLMRFARRRSQLCSCGRSEGFQEKIAKPARWRDNPGQNAADLLFH